MLVLAHLLVQNPEWRHRPIRVLHAIPPNDDQEEAAGKLAKLIELARIRATSEIVVTDDVAREIRERSAQAAVVFLGFGPPEEGEEKAFVEETTTLIEGLPNVILVSNAGDVSLEG
jgi:hypothetical protein